FTFAHRRFQEYFATCVVLRDPSRVTAKQLLSDGRWRETAVVMCQTQPISVLMPLIKQAERSLTRFCNSISDLIDTPLEYVQDKERNTTNQQKPTLRHFPWPAGTLHLLG